MMSLTAGLAVASSPLLTVAVVAAAAGLVVAVVLGVQLHALRRRFRTLLDGARGENLERMLIEHADQRVQFDSRLEKLERQSTNLDRRVKSSVRYVGLVRFDAFPDVGGRQSFALAVYDEEGNGVVVSSLVGRTDSRVYGKPLVAGDSEHTLSAEEQQAIEQAAYRHSREKLTL
ncbi:MAG: hypothetical protein HONBIEJF_00229 [Fimbriimonadaceae bacterium]|nr:hypothetical protein [Fimbriimonadaceae bacterium]